MAVQGVFLLFSALFSGASSLISNDMNNKALADAKEEAAELERMRIEREEEWKEYLKTLDDKKFALAEKGFEFEKEQFGFQKKEARGAAKERKEAFNYNKRQQSIQNGLQLLNQKQALQNNFINNITRR